MNAKNNSEKNSRIKNSGKTILQQFKGMAGILCAFAAMFLLLSIVSDSFLTQKNLLTVLRSVAVDAMVAFGMTFVIIGGGIDLSVGSAIAFVSVVCGMFMERLGLPIAVSVILSLFCGVAIGAINGFIITKMKILPFITTLGTSYILRGAVHLMTNSQAVMVSDESFYNVGTAYILGIPVTVLYMLVVLLILSVILLKTMYGRKLYAVGGNETAARFSGIHVNRTRMISYCIMGLMAAVAGVIQCAKLFGGQPSIGQNAEMDAIAAAILGGTSFNGGIGTLGGTLVGTLVLGIMNNGLNLLGIRSYWQYVARGAIIIMAVFFDVIRNAKKSKQ